MIKKIFFVIVGVALLYSLCFAQSKTSGKISSVTSLKRIQDEKSQLISSQSPFLASQSTILNDEQIKFQLNNFDTLKNDDGKPYYLFYDVDYNASRFSLATACTLKEAVIGFGVELDSFYIAQDCSLFIWKNSAINTPGERLLTGTFAIGNIDPGYWSRVYVNVAPYELTFTSDFWIGYKQITARSPIGLADSGASSPDRNMWRSNVNDQWNSYNRGDFIIRAIIATDKSGPVINFNHTTVNSPDMANQALITNIFITDNFGVDRAYLFYRQGGAVAYDSLLLEKMNDTTYEGTIPASSITSRGLEYYIKAYDTANNFSCSPATDPVKHPHILIVKIPNLVKPSAQPVKSYRMISIPLNLDNASPDNVLVDDLDEYKDTIWRLFRYQGSDYVEYTRGNIENFNSGKAFWLITKEAKTIDCGAGKSVTTGSNFNISLQPGWNMIGNPFDFEISWNDVIRSNSVEASLWGYDGQGYVNKTRLERWEGYFVKNLESYNVTIEIPPQEVTGLAKPASEFLVKGASEGEWSIQIEARSGNYSDSENYIGSLTSSHTEWDRKDLSEPPQPPGDYVSLYFSHQTWEKHPGSYTTDFRPVSEEGEIWDFIIDANIPDADGVLEFKNLAAVPGGFDVFLFDKALQIAKDLKSNDQYAFKANTSRRFSIIVGTKQFVEKNKDGISLAPDKYALWQNYPNPFNSATTIKYELPKASKVTLNIYNIMGQEIANLINEHQDAGYHAVHWEASDAPTGIYFCRLQAGGFVQMRKMALMR